MPCDQDSYREVQLKRNADRAQAFEAALCAIMTELEKRGLIDEYIAIGSVNGTINLAEFWDEHKKEDRERLAEKLNQFSEHEKNILRQLLSK